MTQDDLKKRVDLHGKWLRDDPSGERLVLIGEDLRYSNLRNCDLRGSGLTGCILIGSIGFLLLPVQDARGYSSPHATWVGTEWKVRSGCRDFTIAEAREHWGEGYDGERSIGDLYLYAIDWLERQPVPSGNAGD